MNSQQRKLAYLAGILVLLGPIIYLGMPPAADTGKDKFQGQLSKLRTTYELGENSLGKVDPSSATMNLALLGLRGVAVNMLWVQADREKEHKLWWQLRQTTDTILQLQPHFEKVWDYHGWNLAYNISVEWDSVPDRWYWVKEGGKFLMQGVEKNRHSSVLFYYTGRILQHKIGASDENVYYRRYFIEDPDVEKYKGKSDPGINPYDDGDNFLAAKRWYERGSKIEAVATEETRERIVDRSVFLSMPARCMIERANARADDGKFGEETRLAWDQAFDAWDKFGETEINAIRRGSNDERMTIKLKVTEDELIRMAPDPNEREVLRSTVDAYQKITNYRYWHSRCALEAEPEMANAHEDIYQAGELYKKQDFEPATQQLLRGMASMEKIIDKQDFSEMRADDHLREEIQLAVLLLEMIHRLSGAQMPPDFPLAKYAAALTPDEKARQELRAMFKRRFESVAP